VTDPDKPTDEQAEKAEEARHREILDRLERMGREHSQEHGAIITRVDDQNKETRAHIGSEVATVRGDVAHTKNFMGRVLGAMKRFLERHGIGTDDL
jgi:hypothetical protein